MTYELKDEQGTLFRNENKQQETHADYNGSARIDGREYWMDAWINNAEDPNKKTYMSFRFKPKEAKTGDHAGGYRPGSDQDPSAPDRPF